MTTNFPSSPRPLAVAAGALLALASGAASAVETNFVGTAQGCFAVSPAISCAPSPGTSTLGDATYADSTFNVTTAGGFVSIGNAPGTPNLDNLGSFNLGGSPFVYDGNHFDLQVSFSAPPSTVPGQIVFADNVTGTVDATSQGGIFVDFDNTPKHFTFGSGGTGGSFDFFVNDVSVTAGHVAAVTGTITAQVTAVPEPETFALFMAGLAAVGFMGRRRKS